MKVVIVGAGMAATRLAELLGSHEVTVLGDEPYYQRHRLTEYVAGRASEPLVEGEFRAAVSVDRGRRVVVDSVGVEHAYDHLVFATGAAPVGGNTLRTVGDARRLVEAAVGARRVVVLGGGVLGVETACALRERGLAVTLVHDGETLLDKRVRATAGRQITRMVRRLGIEAILQARVQVTETQDGRFRALELASGQTVFGDLLVSACGVRPRVELAEAAGLAVAGGIVVDASLTTADPRVHAIGDCAEVDGVVSGTVGAAWDQAEVLADVLNERPVRELAPEVLRLTAGGLDVMVLGDREADGHVVRLADGERYVRAVLVDGVVRAAVAVNAPEVAAELVLLADRRTAVVPEMLLEATEAPRQAKPVCRCNGVTRAVIEAAWKAGADSVDGIAARTRATTGCGSCTGSVGELLERLRRGEADPVPTRRATMTELGKAKHLVVVGGGMVAHRLVEALRSRDTSVEWRVTVLAEEPRLPYDRSR